MSCSHADATSASTLGFGTVLLSASARAATVARCGRRACPCMMCAATSRPFASSVPATITPSQRCELTER